MTYLGIRVVVWVMLYRHVQYLWRPQCQMKNYRWQHIRPVQPILDG